VFATSIHFLPNLIFWARLEPIRVEPLVGLHLNENLKPGWKFLTIGNCDICAEQTILVMNETKWYDIQPKSKDRVQKIFRTLSSNFIKGLNKRWLKFLSFCTDESERNKVMHSFMLKKAFLLLTLQMHEVFNEISVRPIPVLDVILQYLTKKHKFSCNFPIVNKISPYKSMLLFNFVQFHNLSLLHLMFSKVFGKILVSFGLFQILEILALAMAKIKKSILHSYLTDNDKYN
jgi:hypothetical protein